MTKLVFRPEFIIDNEDQREKLRLAMDYLRQNNFEFPKHTTIKSSEFAPGEDGKVAGEVQSYIGPLSMADIAKAWGVDLAFYDGKITANKWEVGMKMKNKDGTYYTLTQPLFQTKVEFVPRKLQDFENLLSAFYDTAKNRFVEDLPEQMMDFEMPPPVVSDELYLVEMCLYDHHFGKPGIDETWTLTTATAHWWAAVKKFLRWANTVNYNTVVLPTGNDLFHIDNKNRTTTAGTQMDAMATYQRVFGHTMGVVVQTINYLKSIGKKVIVPMVDGNHDRNSVIALGQALAVMYAGDEMVEIINTPDGRIYYPWGKNVLGWMHSDECKPERVAQVMNADMRTKGVEFIGKSHFFISVGHLHKTQTKIELAPTGGLTLKPQSGSNTITELATHGGVEMRYMPSLCPTDDYHSRSAFIGAQRKSSALIYAYSGGIENQIFYNM